MVVTVMVVSNHSKALHHRLAKCSTKRQRRSSWRFSAAAGWVLCCWTLGTGMNDEALRSHCHGYTFLTLYSCWSATACFTSSDSQCCITRFLQWKQGISIRSTVYLLPSYTMVRISSYKNLNEQTILLGLLGSHLRHPPDPELCSW